MVQSKYRSRDGLRACDYATHFSSPDLFYTHTTVQPVGHVTSSAQVAAMILIVPESPVTPFQQASIAFLLLLRGRGQDAPRYSSPLNRA